MGSAWSKPIAGHLDASYGTLDGSLGAVRIRIEQDPGQEGRKSQRGALLRCELGLGYGFIRSVSEQSAYRKEERECGDLLNDSLGGCRAELLLADVLPGEELMW